MAHTEEIFGNLIQEAEMVLMGDSNFRVSDEKIPSHPCWCGGGVWSRNAEGNLVMTDHDYTKHRV